MRAARRGALIGLLLGLAARGAGSAAAGEPDAAQVRASAERLAAWAVEARRPGVLASAIAALLAEGATLEPDDPWGAADFLRALREMPDGTAADALDAVPEQTRITSPAAGRGATMGVTRAEITLAPGARAGFDLAFQAREIAIVEARLRRGSEGADVDLRVTDASGATLAEDVGAETGRPGYGLYVEWLPETCATARLELANVGAGEARLVMLTPPSEQSQCVE